MPALALREYLDENQIRYEIMHHSPAYTAQEIAALTHVRGRELAKSVIVRIDGKLAMVVLPASKKINLELLLDELDADEVELPTEAEFRNRFPGCETGAMPPFGNLYGMEVYADEALSQDDVFAFNAGTHRELMWMRFSDFERLAQPQLLQSSTVAFA